ncbi:hypothetical protein GE21DRAFT_1312573 [Neurospora crassa]|nr:hypothetical protein GE21DRAFT_1312573 [Neurospora crassa]
MRVSNPGPTPDAELECPRVRSSVHIQCCNPRPEARVGSEKKEILLTGGCMSISAIYIYSVEIQYRVQSTRLTVS